MRYFIASFLSVVLIGVFLSSCVLSIPENFLSSESSSQSRASASSSQYINEMCWMYEDHNSCIINTLDNANHYVGFRDSLFFNCTSLKETKREMKTLVKEASRSLQSRNEILSLQDFLSKTNDIEKDFQDDWNDCFNKRSKNRAVTCLERVNNRALQDIGCK